MIVSYNKAHVGDVLLVNFTTERTETVEIERKGDVVLLRAAGETEVKGFNLFNASKYIELDVAGNVEVTKEVAEKLDAALAANNADVKLAVDFSPKFVVGYVEQKEKHPNADKLSVCQVNVGNETLQIVCGAPNVDAGQKVVVAKIGAVMPSGLVIKAGNLRGEDSFGMLCAARELDIPNAPQEKGILVLEEDAVVGSEFVVPKN
ncbi:MAG: DUF4479 domain-containing protein [Caryophanon sp.]|nr:DUF4479 domain-containing protein [Caryophanon sp.]